VDDHVEAGLAAAAEALREFEVTNLRAADLHRRMVTLLSQVDGLRAHHAAEHKDVERLAGMSLPRVLAVLRGDLADRRAAEAAEADAAYYRLRVAEAYLAAVRREYESARSRLAELAGAPAAYAAALGAKERRLLESGDPRRARLLALADERGRLAGELHELGEAQQAASTAHAALRQVLDRLDVAARWRLSDWFDNPLAGARVDSWLQLAAAAAAHADWCLAGLRVELVDVAGAVPPAMWPWVERTTRFFELWRNPDFTRLRVSEQVAWARRNVDGPMQLVHDVRIQLEQRAAAVRARLGQIEAERQILIGG
jgi:hypothetical protein